MATPHGGLATGVQQCMRLGLAAERATYLRREHPFQGEQILQGDVTRARWEANAPGCTCSSEKSRRKKVTIRIPCSTSGRTSPQAPGDGSAGESFHLYRQFTATHPQANMCGREYRWWEKSTKKLRHRTELLGHMDEERDRWILRR